MSRRSFIRFAAGGAVATAVGLPLLLDACGSGEAGSPASATASGSGSAGTRGGLQLPAYVPFQGPKPDLPPSSDGVVPAGFKSYPKSLVRATDGPVGKGDDVNLFTYTINPPPTPVDQNKAWQQINKGTGVNLKFPTVALQDYNTKLATLVSGGDLPDMFTMNVLDVYIPNEIEFLTAACTDLTPFVGGDAIKAYPNLANFPPQSWKKAIFNGKIYALPRLTNGVGSALLVQQNLFDQQGVTTIANTDDFTKIMKSLTKPGSQWGLGGMGADHMDWMLGVFRAPNNWKQSAGKFTKDYETEEFKGAVAYLRSLWDAGVVSPDTPTFIQQQGAAKFYAGEFALYPTNYFAFQIARDRLLAVNKNFKLNALVEFGHDGGKVTHFQSSPSNQITVLKKASPDRIKELLGVLNYLASPFGTEEYQVIYYGIKGAEFDYDANGNPVRNKQGQADVQYSPWSGIISPPPVTFDPDVPEFAGIAQPIEMAAHEIAVVDPTIGLYSPTLATKGAILTQKMNDGINSIIFGRAPVSSFDQLVKDWRAGGGDQIRSEYEQAFQKAPAAS